MQKFLVIQTAFIGDVVLATALIEKLHTRYPDARIDFLVRKGNEALLTGHPYLHEVLVWDKKQNKLRNLFRLIGRIRKTGYDKVINVQRFAATGLLTALSGAKETIGFDKNPFSRFFTHRIPHIVSAPEKAVRSSCTRTTSSAAATSPATTSPAATSPVAATFTPTTHEIDRNQTLIAAFTGDQPARPRLYPTAADEDKVKAYKTTPYITISPASVWFTKQYPPEKWASFIRKLPPDLTVYLLGAPADTVLCQSILDAIATANKQRILNAITPANNQHTPDAISNNQSTPDTITPPHTPSIINLSGQLSFLQSAALQKDAGMNYVNDSAPLHFASAVNAPVTAVYCSTIPAFGFGPLSDNRHIVELPEPLDCRPCGLHGYKACPLGHFHCAYKIQDQQLLATLPRTGASD